MWLRIRWHNAGLFSKNIGPRQWGALVEWVTLAEAPAKSPQTAPLRDTSQRAINFITYREEDRVLNVGLGETIQFRQAQIFLNLLINTQFLCGLCIFWMEPLETLFPREPVIPCENAGRLVPLSVFSFPSAFQILNSSYTSKNPMWLDTDKILMHF